MSKSKGLYVDRSTLIEQIKEICDEMWSECKISDMYPVGNMNRIDICADGKKAILNFFFKEDGTTIQAAGANKDIAQLIKAKLEERTEYKGNIENTTCSFKKLPYEWGDKLIKYLTSCPGIKISATEIDKAPKHIEYDLSSNYGDKLVINRYSNGTLVLQGKPAYIFGEAISLLSYCKSVSVEDVVSSVSNINKVEVKTGDVHNELKAVLKNSYDYLEPAIIKMLSPAVAMRNVSIDLDDYSCFVFPALRALEGYIKWLFQKKGVYVGNTFNGIFSGYSLCPAVATQISDSVFQAEIENLFKYYKDNRHIHFHASQVLVSTKLIENRNEADIIINEVIERIDSSYIKMGI
ncbi:type II toxin-antitoxin system RnlA family toxin [Butyrivibrio hungatei]|uniref:Uncharacterized protein n=1 Tax=Butyrivibrio hungatei TaxID=185008 RepID=A0A1D9P153_9FIRM|nr:type II toxin-antitoxin system RnlA family toxin [Butyrivibrio hungatei]AOZ96232.1 hypothetical protein bhn_I1198 [Butyrivibrio hungatei]